VVHGMREINVGTVVGQPQGTVTLLIYKQAYREQFFVGVAVQAPESWEVTVVIVGQWVGYAPMSV
jgi:hypothetical protein